MALQTESTMTTDLSAPLAQLLLSVADDKLMQGHRNSDWTGLGPILEQDIAFSSLAQDEMAHASALYELLASHHGPNADTIAFGRSPDGYRCSALVEVADDFDWATALVRGFLCDHFDLLRLERLSNSSNNELAALSKRLRAEESVHVEHVDEWMRRMGTGTGESRTRVQKALDALAPIASMHAEPVDGINALEADGTYPPLASGDLFDAWRASLQPVLDAAGFTLKLDAPDAGTPGGRRGVHTEQFVPLLDEMCEVFRIEPNGNW
ncbi:MAG: 1,2-phenylacetyl-CoA epoxidase subunit PaaC [Planctomycetota bacterium]|jgi:ring-1,2-phenylacetyl-CoA epoxidase subunit PaaC